MGQIRIESGKWAAMWLPKKASTAFSSDSLVDIFGGYVQPSNSTSGVEHQPVLGVYSGPSILSTSTTTDLVRVFVPVGPAQIRATGVSGTLQVASLGSQVDMYDAQTVNAPLSVYGPLTVTKYVSATEGLFAIGKSIYANVA